jgi:flagella basal body P-ring formation protein FlgA
MEKSTPVLVFVLLLSVPGRADIVIHAPEIRLSDLFELPPDTQNTVVMPTPPIGDRQEIPVSFLKTLAQQHHLSCVGLKTVHVVRAASKKAADAVVSVPVLKVPKQRGEDIILEDIMEKKVPEKLVHNNIVRHAEDLIGRVTCGSLRAGVPLKKTDTKTPVLVRRNATVTLRVKMNNLCATVGGKALEEGSYGDTIRVMNTQSGKTVEGTVYDNKIVDIVPISG